MFVCVCAVLLQSLLNVPKTEVTRLPSGLTVATENSGGNTCTVCSTVELSAGLSFRLGRKSA